MSAAAAAPRKTISIYDYPEHLNPFREDERHSKMKFWTIGRRLSRANSINFSGIKDLKNSWALRSFMKKGKKPQPPPSQENKNNYNHVNGDNSPVVYRRTLQHSSTTSEIDACSGARNTSPPVRPPRYIYGGSVTPLPRSRFQERLRCSSQQEVSSLSATPRMARSEISGSRLSVESANPFDECPVPPVRASRRKKKRAAPLPPNDVADVSISKETPELRIAEEDEKKETKQDDKVDPQTDLYLEELNTHVELKIVEDEDVNGNAEEAPRLLSNTKREVLTIKETTKQTDNEKQNNEPMPEQIIDLDNNMKTVSFPKVDIVKYRRNSSINEDDIRLRRGNLEDFHALTNKRSKSLNNAYENSEVTYNTNLNEKNNNTSTTKDSNGNEEPQKVVCKVYDANSRKQSVDTISSTEKEFIEIEKVRKEFESEINKLNAALENDFATGARLSVSEIKRKYDKTDMLSPNPIPKPQRSHYGEIRTPVNGNVHT